MAHVNDNLNKLHSLKSWNDCITHEEEEEYILTREGDEWIKVQDAHIRDRLNTNKPSRFTMWLLPLMPGLNPNGWMVRVVRGGHFTAASTLLIVLNGAWMAFETDQGMKGELGGDPLPKWMSWIDVCFIFLFFIELVLRIVALRIYFFFGPDWRWHWFDMILVVISGIHVMASTYVTMNVSFIFVLRVLRIVRTARLIRVLSFFHELRFMVSSIISSLGSMIWSFLLILVVVFVFSIFFMQCATSHLESRRNSGNWQDEVHVTELLEVYGTLWLTMWHLLQAISGGKDWADIVDPIGAIHWSYSLAFLGYIFFVVIGVLNVLVGVFVTAAAENLDKDLVIRSEVLRKNRFVDEMRDLFREFDTQDSLGKISWAQFRQHLDNEEVQAYLSLNQLDSSDAFMLFNLLDRNRQKEIDMTEFIQGCLRLKGQARCSDVAFNIQETQRVRADLLAFQHSVIGQLSAFREQLQQPRVASKGGGLAMDWVQV